MGLTIHYNLKYNQQNAEQIVSDMRQLALDLPFEEVGEVVDLKGPECDVEARRDELQKGDEKSQMLFWLMIQSGIHVKCPWNKRISRTVNPKRIIAFSTWPGPGCEAANFGLCLYPSEIDWLYKVENDERFQSAPLPGHMGGYQFDWLKWDRYRAKQHIKTTRNSLDEMRKVPTEVYGWSWHSFCKTQYASDPRCGGVPNFLRCHISVITLLDRMAKLPGLKVKIEDEGKYGPSTYSDDWQEADKAGRKPTYKRHKGQYSPIALIKEVGDWNNMMAAFVGALSDALTKRGGVEAPIKNFPDFETLEFRGHNQKHLIPFLQALKKIAIKVE